MHRTNVELDEKLVSQAMKITRIDTKKQLLNYALGELVRKAKRKKILMLEGKVNWTGNLDETRKSRP
jgi:Arc/MetJ family transcription regulator